MFDHGLRGACIRRCHVQVIVICNAGILNAGPTEDISHTNFMQTLDVGFQKIHCSSQSCQVNVASHQLLFSLFLHESISDANTLNLISFVSISSAMAFSASAFLSAYCASKYVLTFRFERTVVVLFFQSSIINFASVYEVGEPSTETTSEVLCSVPVPC